MCSQGQSHLCNVFSEDKKRWIPPHPLELSAFISEAAPWTHQKTQNVEQNLTFSLETLGSLKTEESRRSSFGPGAGALEGWGEAHCPGQKEEAGLNDHQRPAEPEKPVAQGCPGST